MGLLKQSQGMTEFLSIDVLYDRMVEIARKAENIK
jgi:flagellum-specific ATP synthase